MAIKRPALPEPPNAGVLQRVKDFGLDVVGHGGLGIMEAGVGIADILSGGYAGKGLENLGIDFPAYHEAINRQMSEERQHEQQMSSEAFDRSFLEGLKYNIENPAGVIGTTVASLPLAYGGAGIARGAGKVIPALGNLYAKGGIQANLARGIAGEGVVMAASQAENLRQQNPEGTLDLMDYAATGATGVVGGAIGGVGGHVAQKLGIADIDMPGISQTELLRTAAKKSIARRMGEGFIQEGLIEELPQSALEQIANNIATDQPWDTGVAEAAGMGFLSGGLMGAGMQSKYGIKSKMFKHLEDQQEIQKTRLETLNDIQERFKADKAAVTEKYAEDVAAGKATKDLLGEGSSFDEQKVAENISSSSQEASEDITRVESEAEALQQEKARSAEEDIQDEYSVRMSEELRPFKEKLNAGENFAPLIAFSIKQDLTRAELEDILVSTYGSEARDVVKQMYPVIEKISKEIVSEVKDTVKYHTRIKKPTFKLPASSLDAVALGKRKVVSTPKPQKSGDYVLSDGTEVTIEAGAKPVTISELIEKDKVDDWAKLEGYESIEDAFENGTTRVKRFIKGQSALYMNKVVSADRTKVEQKKKREAQLRTSMSEASLDAIKRDSQAKLAKQREREEELKKNKKYKEFYSKRFNRKTAQWKNLSGKPIPNEKIYGYRAAHILEEEMSKRKKDFEQYRELLDEGIITHEDLIDLSVVLTSGKEVKLGPVLISEQTDHLKQRNLLGKRSFEAQQYNKKKAAEQKAVNEQMPELTEKERFALFDAEAKKILEAGRKQGEDIEILEQREAAPSVDYEGLFVEELSNDDDRILPPKIWRTPLDFDGDSIYLNLMQKRFRKIKKLYGDAEVVLPPAKGEKKTYSAAVAKHKRVMDKNSLLASGYSDFIADMLEDLGKEYQVDTIVSFILNEHGKQSLASFDGVPEALDDFYVFVKEGGYPTDLQVEEGDYDVATQQKIAFDMLARLYGGSFLDASRASKKAVIDNLMAQPTLFDRLRVKYIEAQLERTHVEKVARSHVENEKADRKILGENYKQYHRLQAVMNKTMTDEKTVYAFLTALDKLANEGLSTKAKILNQNRILGSMNADPNAQKEFKRPETPELLELYEKRQKAKTDKQKKQLNDEIFQKTRAYQQDIVAKLWNAMQYDQPSDPTANEISEIRNNLVDVQQEIEETDTPEQELLDIREDLKTNLVNLLEKKNPENKKKILAELRSNNFTSPTLEEEVLDTAYYESKSYKDSWLGQLTQEVIDMYHAIGSRTISSMKDFEKAAPLTDQNNQLFRSRAFMMNTAGYNARDIEYAGELSYKENGEEIVIKYPSEQEIASAKMVDPKARVVNVSKRYMKANEIAEEEAKIEKELLKTIDDAGVAKSEAKKRIKRSKAIKPSDTEIYNVKIRGSEEVIPMSFMEIVRARRAAGETVRQRLDPNHKNLIEIQKVVGRDGKEVDDRLGRKTLLFNYMLTTDLRPLYLKGIEAGIPRSMFFQQYTRIKTLDAHRKELAKAPKDSSDYEKAEKKFNAALEEVQVFDRAVRMKVLVKSLESSLVVDEKFFDKIREDFPITRAGAKNEVEPVEFYHNLFVQLGENLEIFRSRVRKLHEDSQLDLFGEAIAEAGRAKEQKSSSFIEMPDKIFRSYLSTLLPSSMRSRLDDILDPDVGKISDMTEAEQASAARLASFYVTVNKMREEYQALQDAQKSFDEFFVSASPASELSQSIESQSVPTETFFAKKKTLTDYEQELSDKYGGLRVGRLYSKGASAFYKAVAKVFGADLVIVSDHYFRSRYISRASDGKAKIIINVQSPSPFSQVFGHELFHHVVAKANKAEYKAFRKAVIDTIGEGDFKRALRDMSLARGITVPEVTTTQALLDYYAERDISEEEIFAELFASVVHDKGFYEALEKTFAGRNLAARLIVRLIDKVYSFSKTMRTYDGTFSYEHSLIGSEKQMKQIHALFADFVGHSLSQDKSPLDKVIRYHTPLDFDDQNWDADLTTKALQEIDTGIFMDSDTLGQLREARENTTGETKQKYERLYEEYKENYRLQTIEFEGEQRWIEVIDKIERDGLSFDPNRPVDPNRHVEPTPEEMAQIKKPPEQPAEDYEEQFPEEGDYEASEQDDQYAAMNEQGRREAQAEEEAQPITISEEDKAKLKDHIDRFKKNIASKTAKALAPSLETRRKKLTSIAWREKAGPQQIAKTALEYKAIQELLAQKPAETKAQPTAKQRQAPEISPDDKQKLKVHNVKFKDKIKNKTVDALEASLEVRRKKLTSNPWRKKAGKLQVAKTALEYKAVEELLDKKRKAQAKPQAQETSSRRNQQDPVIIEGTDDYFLFTGSVLKKYSNATLMKMHANREAKLSSAERRKQLGGHVVENIIEEMRMIANELKARHRAYLKSEEDKKAKKEQARKASKTEPSPKTEEDRAEETVKENVEEKETPVGPATEETLKEKVLNKDKWFKGVWAKIFPEGTKNRKQVMSQLEKHMEAGIEWLKTHKPKSMWADWFASPTAIKYMNQIVFGHQKHIAAAAYEIVRKHKKTFNHLNDDEKMNMFDLFRKNILVSYDFVDNDGKTQTVFRKRDIPQTNRTLGTYKTEKTKIAGIDIHEEDGRELAKSLGYGDEIVDAFIDYEAQAKKTFAELRKYYPELEENENHYGLSLRWFRKDGVKLARDADWESDFSKLEGDKRFTKEMAKDMTSQEIRDKGLKLMSTDPNQIFLEYIGDAYKLIYLKKTILQALKSGEAKIFYDQFLANEQGYRPVADSSLNQDFNMAMQEGWKLLLNSKTDDYHKNEESGQDAIYETREEALRVADSLNVKGTAVKFNFDRNTTIQRYRVKFSVDTPQGLKEWYGKTFDGSEYEEALEELARQKEENKDKKGKQDRRVVITLDTVEKAAQGKPKAKIYLKQDMATMMNNYLGKDHILSNSFFGISGRKVMDVKNQYTSIEFAISLFHAMTIGQELIASTAAWSYGRARQDGQKRSFKEIIGSYNPATGLREAREIAAFMEAVLADRGLAKDEAIKRKAQELFKTENADVLDAIIQFYNAGGLTGMDRSLRSHVHYEGEMRYTEGDATVKVVDGEVVISLPKGERLPAWVPGPFSYGPVSRKAIAESLKEVLQKHLNENPDHKLNAYYRVGKFALMEGTTAWLMEQGIPRIKMAMWAREYTLELDRQKNQLITGETSKEFIARNTMKFIEDRFGEVNWMNTWMKPTYKTSLQMMFRSFTWFTGSWNALAKAGIDVGKLGWFTVKGEEYELTNRGLWAMNAIVAHMMAVGLVYSMFAMLALAAGGGEEDDEEVPFLTQLLFPRTNPLDPEKRVAIPSYVTEWYKLLRHLGVIGHEVEITKTISGRFNSLIGKGLDIYNNQDFRGVAIRNEAESTIEQTFDALIHLAPLPISVSSGLKNIRSKGFEFSDFTLAMTGMVDAPAAAKRSSAANMAFKIRRQEYKGREITSDEMALKDEAKRAAYAFGQGDREPLMRMAKEGRLSKKQVMNAIKRIPLIDGKPNKLYEDPLTSAMKGLTIMGALKVWEYMSEAERERHRPAILKKYKNMHQRGYRSGEFKKEIRDRMKELKMFG